jgi:hypothetical protein
MRSLNLPTSKWVRTMTMRMDKTSVATHHNGGEVCLGARKSISFVNFRPSLLPQGRA